jgi:hypothetical protein
MTAYLRSTAAEVIAAKPMGKARAALARRFRAA